MKTCKNLAFLAILAGIFALWPMGAGAAVTTMRFSHTFAPDSLEDRCAHSFSQQVEKQTNGEIKIQIFPASQIGDTLASFQGMTLGTLDFHMIDITTTSYLKGHEEFQVGCVPYLFDSPEDARRIYNSDVYAPFYERVRKEKGIRVIAVRGDRAPRTFNTTKGPIFGLEDCKGIKIRVAPIPVTVKAFEIWGFKPTPINFNELFMALKQGVVDGQDNGLDVTVPLKFTEVAKYLAFSNHQYSIYGWFISEKTWNKASAKYQGIMEKEAKAAGDLLTKLSGQREIDDLNTILKAGAKVTIPNRVALRETAKDVYKEFEGKVWPAGLVEKIRAMQKR